MTTGTVNAPISSFILRGETLVTEEQINESMDGVLLPGVMRGLGNTGLAISCCWCAAALCLAVVKKLRVIAISAEFSVEVNKR